MPKTKLHELAELGQAMWLDYIRRSMIDSGQLGEYVEMGLRGLTSNPSIFEKAIAGSDDYDDQIKELASQSKTAEEIFEILSVDDIQRATDVLRPVYDESEALDGYVSLEVSPHLAHDTEGTIEQARDLFAKVDRPNTFIKVPATEEGYPAIETLLAEGLNINITLMFSMEQYENVVEAFLSALEKRAEQSQDLSRIASVASFFVSRVDVKVDTMLDQLPVPEAKALKGKIGIANAKMVYQRFKEIFDGARWERLAAQGAQRQRVLWASTSTKNPDYPDTLYADNLIGRHTVNTVPPDTLEAFLDHGTVALTVEQGLEEARNQLDSLAEVGIDLDTVTLELLAEGIVKFSEPVESLMGTIATKKSRLMRGGIE
jgi:transaldolase